MNEWQQYMTSGRSERMIELDIAGTSEYIWYVIVIYGAFHKLNVTRK